MKTEFSDDLAKVSCENEKFQKTIQNLEDELKSQKDEIEHLNVQNRTLQQTVTSKNTE